MFEQGTAGSRRSKHPFGGQTVRSGLDDERTFVVACCRTDVPARQALSDFLSHPLRRLTTWLPSPTPASSPPLHRPVTPAARRSPRLRVHRGRPFTRAAARRARFRAGGRSRCSARRGSGDRRRGPGHAAVASLVGGGPPAAGESSPGSAVAPGAADPARCTVVQPGETLWSIAGEIAPGDDVRLTVDRLVELNGDGAARHRPASDLVPG